MWGKMKKRPSEVVPDDEIIFQVCDKSVLPLIRRFEKDAKEPMPTTIEVWADGLLVKEVDIGIQTCHKGVVRLHFEKTFKPNIYIFL